MYNGIINVYKEKGYTSHDVVAKLRGILHQKKIGHTGTLDPDAQGVLPVCLGCGTKLCDMLTDRDKTYKAVLVLGMTTDTQDTSGTVISEKKVAVTVDEAVAAINSFVGEYAQVPPMYSALKVNGKKLYELAREGIEVERKPRNVTIYSIDIEDISLPEITITVSCSKGTYIRTLCADIGEKLGCGGCMKSLLRTHAAGFDIKDSLTLAQIEELMAQGKLEEHIKGVESVFSELESVHISKEREHILYNGNPFFVQDTLEKAVPAVGNRYKAYGSNSHFVGIYEYTSEGRYLPVKIFDLSRGNDN